jgi:hypothetical protein
MRVEIKLTNHEECNSCLLLLEQGQAEERYRCKYYNQPLEADVRHRIKRPQRCILDNGR